jgi:hypothetical protein
MPPGLGAHLSRSPGHGPELGNSNCRDCGLLLQAGLLMVFAETGVPDLSDFNDIPVGMPFVTDPASLGDFIVDAARMSAYFPDLLGAAFECVEQASKKPDFVFV